MDDLVSREDRKALDGNAVVAAAAADSKIVRLSPREDERIQFDLQCWENLVLVPNPHSIWVFRELLVAEDNKRRRGLRG